MGLPAMSQPQRPDEEKFWTRQTWLQMIFLGIAGGAFLIGLIALLSAKLVH
jgi:hypothetical protein